MSSVSAPSTHTVSLVPLVSAVRVSSVLNGAVAEYGKQHLLDGSLDTCWNSEQGSPQYVQLTFTQPVHISSVAVTFQGGFVGRPLEVSVVRDGSRRFEQYQVYDTLDHNSPQTFPFHQSLLPAISAVGSAVIAVKLHFPTSTDLFGRVTIYNLDVTGTPSAATNALH